MLPTSCWHRSSFCEDGGNNCVELTGSGEGIALRESESPAQVILTGPTVLRGLLAGLKAGVADDPAP
ncbi:DUF397 domain-containing protein [Streptomyces sp. AV19]|uniref:DUF397 domain-containing protein n=1 Tax=Streptomyces sp. AV19 TaxID=2793068 RepID=UPI0018FE03CA|nr:DUF397 domain-containing protein [Streptomyces sp. AV19]MBH1933870.1 DUF397 domain-containing protein [Streptomyces sp. AV19]MDG4535642.1 DUF397 domain-containing protein [Streptomyces sp. AV19]